MKVFDEAGLRDALADMEKPATRRQRGLRSRKIGLVFSVMTALCVSSLHVCSFFMELERQQLVLLALFLCTMFAFITGLASTARPPLPSHQKWTSFEEALARLKNTARQLRSRVPGPVLIGFTALLVYVAVSFVRTALLRGDDAVVEHTIAVRLVTGHLMIFAFIGALCFAYFGDEGDPHTMS